jgi:hypothetical protein
MRKIFVGIGIITIAVGIVWAARAWNTLRVNARTAQFNNNVDDLFTALQKYKEKVGPIRPAATWKFPRRFKAPIAKT